MKHLYRILAAAAVILCAACFTACNKASLGNSNNPVAVSLPAADFSITILDYEHGYDRDSNYVFEGEWKGDAFYFGLYRTEKMIPNITPDNTITFRITSDSPDFQGVNASSSKGGINIVQDGNDHTVYHLEWVAEGESEITFWNGEGEAKKSVSFKATSKKEIPIEGFKVCFRGVETNFNRMFATEYNVGYHPGPFGEIKTMDWKWINRQDSPHSMNSYASDVSEGWDGMEPMELFPIPLNATPKKYIADFKVRGVVPDNTKELGFRYVTYEELYSENLKHFSGFSWIDPNSYEKDLAPTGSESTVEDWEKNHQDCLSVYPSDLRERKIIIQYSGKWQIYASIKMDLYSGNLRDFSQREVENYRIHVIDYIRF